MKLETPQMRIWDHSANTAGAIFNEDRTRRYLLWLDFRGPSAPFGKQLGFVMLNPSKANETENDPTIGKCIGFAKHWGFSSITVANLISVISTDPKKLSLCHERDDKNQIIWRSLLKECDMVCVAWGNQPVAVKRATGFSERKTAFCLDADQLQVELFCIGYTQDKEPKHPSRAPYTQKPQAWEWQ